MLALACAGLAAASLLPPESGGPEVGGLRRARHEQGRRPNVLLIVTDDQRLHTMAVMPTTRRWFKRGGREFTEAVVTTPLCCPARASFLTGRYAHNHRVHTNQDALDLDPRTTVQRYLRRKGYLTAFSGKFMNSWPIHRAPPHFDRWHTQSGGYRERTVNDDGRVRTVSTYSTHYIGRKAVQFLRWFEGGDRRPWFLVVMPNAPHGPFTPERKYRRASVPRWSTRSPAVNEDDKSDKPPWVQERNATERAGRRIRRKQLRTLMSVDDLVGRVMREVRRLGENRRTLAIFSSDNGFFWSEHGLSDKRLPYTEAIRVPLFLRWPGHVRRGSVDGRLATNVDLVPTILHAARLRKMALVRPLDGRSLLGRRSRGRLHLEYWKDPVGKFVPRWASTRGTGYQYVESYGDGGGVTFREYYDLVADPWQLVNLLRDGNPLTGPTDEELQALSRRLRADRRCRGTSGSRACP